MSLGLQGADWQNMQQDYVGARTNRYRMANVTSFGSASTVQTNGTTINSATGYAVSKEGNTCTDGADDGHIGFWQGLWCGIKGAGKGFLKGLAGCVTDSNGNFSLGKTLLTVGAVAACIAFPAVGVVACGVGLVSGGAKVVSGISAASKATTDAAKKDALESIGDGTFTVVSSALGMKASINAVKATSTVAKASQVDDMTNAVKSLENLDKVDDIAGALKNLDNADDVAQAISKLDNADDIARVISEQGHFKDVSKLGNLAEDATKLEKLGALGQDMVSSTKNNGVKALELLKDVKSAADIKRLQHTKSGLEAKQAKGTLSESQQTRLNNVTEQLSNKTNNASQGALDKLDDLNNFTQRLKDGRADVKEARGNLSEARKALSNLKKAHASEEQIAQAKATVSEMETAFKNAQNSTGIRGAVHNLTSKSETLSYLSEAKSTLTQGGIKNIVTNMKANKDAIRASSFFASLTEDAQAIVTVLTEESYASAVSQYGYNNVLSVIESFWGGYRMLDNTI